MGDFTENAIDGVVETVLMTVRYPANHHRYAHSGHTPQPFGNNTPLPRPLAELLAWSLRRQGATVTLETATPQLTLFG